MTDKKCINQQGIEFSAFSSELHNSCYSPFFQTELWYPRGSLEDSQRSLQNLYTIWIALITQMLSAIKVVSFSQANNIFEDN